MIMNRPRLMCIHKQTKSPDTDRHKIEIKPTDKHTYKHTDKPTKFGSKLKRLKERRRQTFFNPVNVMVKKVMMQILSKLSG